MSQPLQSLVELYNLLPGRKVTAEDSVCLEDLLPALDARVKSLTASTLEIASECNVQEALLEKEEQRIRDQVRDFRGDLAKKVALLSDLESKLCESEKKEEELKKVVYRLRALKDRREMNSEVEAKIVRDVGKARGEYEMCTMKSQEYGEEATRLRDILAREEKEMLMWKAQCEEGKAMEHEISVAASRMKKSIDEERGALKSISRELDKAKEMEKRELKKLKNARLLAEDSMDWDAAKYLTASEVNAALRQWISEVRRKGGL